ncbi:MAG: hypothetical protein R3B48_02705 [Kofleriaceae bacterium]
MSTSRFAALRKRLAPLVLVIAGLALAHETCANEDRREVTVRFELGEGAPRVRELHVDLFVNGDAVSQLHRARTVGLAMGAPEMKSVLPGRDVELRIELAVDAADPAAADGRARRGVVTRRIHAEGGAVVSVPLADDIARLGAAPERE